MFIRFTSASSNDQSGALEGLFSVAYRLRDAGDLDEHDAEALTELFAWFGERLPKPLCFWNLDELRATVPGSLGEIGARWGRRPRDVRRCLSWFKASAVEHVQRAQHLASILRRNGVEVREIRTHAPGRVICEDRWQVVTEPHRDTKTKGNRPIQ